MAVIKNNVDIHTRKNTVIFCYHTCTIDDVREDAVFKRTSYELCFGNRTQVWLSREGLEELQALINEVLNG